ncbi:MAG TPA: GNAT family N-acetyltransferase [Phnomibacter sp.]|nr:GNAT family N-acetyltransferase [Phnomibacter sp.]
MQQIRSAIATEVAVPELVALINSAYRGDSSRRGWTTEADILEGTRIDEAGIREIIDDPKADLHTFLLADEGLVACVYLKEETDALYLGMLTVRPTLQAGGLGKYILNYAEELAKQKGKPKVRMTVINKRLELIAWYNRHGYLPTGETEPWVDGVHIGERKADIYFVVLEKQLS